MSEAARKLYISQPSLSYIISKVEEDLGVKLFDRKTNPITLTYAGERYVETARQILLLSDNLRRELTDIGQGERGRIRLGIPTERAGYMLPKVIGRFRELYPGVHIQLMESKSEEILGELEKDKIAFAVLPGSGQEFPVGLLSELIYRERVFFVTAPGRLPEEMILPPGEDGVPTVKLKMTKQMPYIIMKRGQYIRKKTDQIFRKANFFPKEAMEISSCVSAVELARAGLGVTIVPERAIGALGNPENIDIYHYNSRPDYWDVSAVYKENAYLDRTERCLIDLMKQEFGEE